MDKKPSGPKMDKKPYFMLSKEIEKPLFGKRRRLMKDIHSPTSINDSNIQDSDTESTRQVPRDAPTNTTTENSEKSRPILPLHLSCYNFTDEEETKEATETRQMDDDYGFAHMREGETRQMDDDHGFAHMREGLTRLEMQKQCEASFYKDRVYERWMDQVTQSATPFDVDHCTSILNRQYHNADERKRAIQCVEKRFCKWFTEEITTVREMMREIVLYVVDMKRLGGWGRRDKSMFHHVKKYYKIILTFCDEQSRFAFYTRYLFLKSFACSMTLCQDYLLPHIKERVVGSYATTWQQMVELSSQLDATCHKPTFKRIVTLVNLRKMLFALTYIVEKTVEVVETARPMLAVLASHNRFWVVCKDLPPSLTYSIVKTYPEANLLNIYDINTPPSHSASKS